MSKGLTAKGFGPRMQRYRTAHVELQMGDHHEQLKVIAATPDHHSNIVLLGRDIPFFWDIVKKYVKSIDVVNTKAQAKRDEE